MSQTANGLYKLTMYLRPDQYLWLRAEALKGVMDKGGGRPDVSVILREMVDHYKAQMEAAAPPPAKGPRRRRVK
jgi:hypothetical protein